MLNKIDYKLLQDDEFELSKNLISKFKKNIPFNSKFIDWEYFLNPFGKTRIFLALYKNNAVGMLAAVPLKFINNKKIFNGFRIQDVITDVDFIRNQIKMGNKIPKKNDVGIFSNLILKLNEYLDINSEINIGFANKNALPYWEKNNWQGISEFPLINKELDKNYNYLCTYNEIKEFNNTHEKIFKKNISNNIDIMWTKEFSNWRYFLNPRSIYKVFEIKFKNDLEGYVILKEYIKDDKKIGHICQIVCKNDLVEDVIKFSMNFFFNRSIKTLSMWRISNDKLLVDKIGFKKEFIKKNKFIYRGKEILSKSNWDISMSYSDIY